MTIESEEFLSFSSKINESISAYMLGVDMNVTEYNYNYFWEEITRNRLINIRPFPFVGIARQSISGMIVKDEYETTLAYNSNMHKKRQNFTISHELIHGVYHLDGKNNMFTDTKATLSYSYADILPEFQANIGASAILLPEPVLINELKEGTAPYLISDRHGISERALYMRLVQQMQASFEASYISASKTASKIMSGQSKQLSIELGKNLERKALFNNPFYEAICI